MGYSDYKESNPPKARGLSNKQVTNAFSPMTFAHSSGFVPVSMEIKEAEDARGRVPARVCLLGRDRVTYKVYALPEEMATGRHAATDEDAVMQ
jgi:anaphase-promoting complex subunit 4